MIEPHEFRTAEYDDGYDSRESFERDVDPPDDTAYETRRRETNEELVVRLMRYSRFGTMSQVFILDAITKCAQAVADMTLDEVREQFGDASFIRPEAWHGVATEITEEIAEYYRG